MPLTNDQLQAEIVALTARVDSLDGQNLVDPSLASITVLTAKIASLQADLGQVTLLFEDLYDKLSKQVTANQTTLNTHLGI